MTMNPVELLEQEIKNWIGARHVVALDHGSSAIHLGIRALGLGSGDKIVTTPFTFIAGPSEIVRCGCRPVFVDIDPETYLLDAEKTNLRVKEDGDIKAVMTTHLFGRMDNMANLILLKETQRLRGRRIYLIEDASQAFGAKLGGQYAGTWGDFGAFSAYASKNLWWYEGGLLMTEDKNIAKIVRMLRDHGQDEKDRMVLLSSNYKLGWLLAFQGWQLVRLHKPAIIAELARFDLDDLHDEYLVYSHPWWQENKDKWETDGCPNAERIAESMRSSRSI